MVLFYPSEKILFLRYYILVMNITEKILARASGKETVSPDDVIFAKVDKVMLHDVSGPGVIKVFDKLQKQGINVEKLWDPTKVWVAEDHFVPSADKVSAPWSTRRSARTRCKPPSTVCGRWASAPLTAMSRARRTRST